MILLHNRDSLPRGFTSHCGTSIWTTHSSQAQRQLIVKLRFKILKPLTSPAMVEVLTAESSVLVKLVTVTVTEDPNLVCVDTNTCLGAEVLSNSYPHLHGLLHGGARADDGLLQLDDLVKAVNEGVEAGGGHLLLAAAQHRAVTRAPDNESDFDCIFIALC